MTVLPCHTLKKARFDEKKKTQGQLKSQHDKGPGERRGVSCAKIAKSKG